MSQLRVRIDKECVNNIFEHFSRMPETREKEYSPARYKSCPDLECDRKSEKVGVFIGGLVHCVENV